jgi:hypothetical protein
MDPETEPSVLEHQEALRQLLLRFWVTDHGDCHFCEESLEKVTVLTSKRHSRALGYSGNLEYLKNLKNLRFPSRRSRPAREAARLAFRNWIWMFLKWHQWQMVATRILIEFKSSEVGTLICRQIIVPVVWNPTHLA